MQRPGVAHCGWSGKGCYLRSQFSRAKNPKGNKDEMGRVAVLQMICIYPSPVGKSGRRLRKLYKKEFAPRLGLRRDFPTSSLCRTKKPGAEKKSNGRYINTFNPTRQGISKSDFHAAERLEWKTVRGNVSL